MDSMDLEGRYPKHFQLRIPSTSRTARSSYCKDHTLTCSKHGALEAVGLEDGALKMVNLDQVQDLSAAFGHGQALCEVHE